MSAKKNEIFDPKSYTMFLEHIGKDINLNFEFIPLIINKKNKI